MNKYTYPACKTVDVTEDWFGVQLPDPYAWLKAAKSKEVLDFVAAENAYTDAYFDQAALDKKIAQLKAAALPPLPSNGMAMWAPSTGTGAMSMRLWTTSSTPLPPSRR